MQAMTKRKMRECVQKASTLKETFYKFINIFSIFIKSSWSDLKTSLKNLIKLLGM